MKYTLILGCACCLLWCSTASAQMVLPPPSELIQAIEQQQTGQTADQPSSDYDSQQLYNQAIESQQNDPFWDTHDRPAEPAADPQQAAADNNNTDAPPAPEAVDVATGKPKSTSIWKEANKDGAVVALYAAVGPAFDLRNSAAGYSARIGMDIHGTYIGGSIEIPWNTIWARESALREDLRDYDYKTSNSALLLMLKGFIPVSNHVTVDLGAGVGLGLMYKKFFEDSRKYNDVSDGSWYARIQAGAFWMFENHLTLGIEFEFNFGNYLNDADDISPWIDDRNSVSMGIIFNLSYQFRRNPKK